MKKVFKFTLIFFYLTNNSNAQKFDNIIPPAPNAAALAKFVNMPIGYYTGIPEITVPIYEIKTGDLNLPISMNYNAGGIKVAEVASSVGLGWSLNAGGVVTRVIKGLPDDCNLGYLNFNTSINGVIQSSYNQSNYQEFNKLSVYESGMLDTEPDLFFFNFNGRSGSFSFNENAEIVLQPFQKIKIERISDGFNISGWNFTTEDGTIYTFKDKEAVSSYSQNMSGGSTLSVINAGECNNFDLASSWYLTKIISVKNSTIDFHYNYNELNNTNYNYTFKTKYLGSERYFLSAESLLGSFGTCKAPSEVSNIITETSGKRLSKIVFEGGKVSFIPGFERADLINDKTIEKIVIFNEHNKEIKKFDFKYGYQPQAYSDNAIGFIQPSTVSNDDLRLTLFSINEMNVSGLDAKSTYKFSYFPNLPNRLSIATDYWGYFNGKLFNSTTIPYMHDFNSNVTFSGANKNVFPEFAKAGTLYKVEYPSGGFTEYSYEGNECSQASAPPKYQESPNNVILASYPINSGDTYTTNYPWNKTKFFTVSNGSSTESMVHITMNVNCIDPKQCASKFTIYNSNNIIVFNSDGNFANLSPSNYWNNYPLILPNGIYKIEFKNNDNNYIPSFNNINSISITWWPSIAGNKAAGGLRIKAVVTSDALTGNTLSKLINYNIPNSSFPNITGTTSGSIIDQKALEYSYSYHEGYETGCGCDGEMIQHYQVLESNPFYPLLSTKGGNVGYKFVSEYIGNTYNNNIGKNEFVFTTPADYPNFGIGTYPFVPFDSKDYMRGLLLSKTEYKFSYGTYIPIRKVENEYDFFHLNNPNVNIKMSRGLKVKYKRKWIVCPGLSLYPLSEFVYNFYYFSSGYNQIKKTIETNFDLTTNEKLINETNFFYENIKHLNPTKIITKNSKGDMLTTENKYADDYSSITPYSLMLSKNIINPIISTKSFNNNMLISEIKTNYKFWGPLYIPVIESIDEKIGSGSFKTKVKINSYNNAGNILEIEKRNDLKQCYLYGYKYQYPVAHIIGASNSLVGSLIDQSKLNNPSNETELRNELNKIRVGLSSLNAKITTYSYIPLVGVSSITDENNLTTYYNYDGFNRLSNIKNHEGNIVKQICYKFDGQLEDCGIVTFQSSVMSQFFTKNDCISGTIGTSVNYVLAAGMFTSATSQADADLLAYNYLSANGQNYANLNGTCNNIDPCSGVTCIYEWQKCIAGICENGIQVFTDSYNEWGTWYCTYHYEYSDGTWSIDFYTTSGWPCL